MSEHDEQVTLIQWANLQACTYPELSLLLAVPNGARTSMSQALKLKAEGLKRGVPDLFLPVARNSWHGLFIELKYGQGKPSVEQCWWSDRLSEQGYLAVVCWGWIEAGEARVEYWGLKG